MTVFMFCSARDHSIIGFSRDADGRNLPKEWGPWTPTGSRALPVHPGQSDVLMQAIEAEGFYVVKAGET